MDINHYLNLMNIYDGKDLNINVSKPDGTKLPINFSSSSVIIPNSTQRNGIKGSIIYDINGKVMKYYNGLNWIEWGNNANILDPLYEKLDDIREKLKTKVDKVEYTNSKIPMASILGSTLYIVFPIDNNRRLTGTKGMSTTMPVGSISYYAKNTGETINDVRANMNIQKNQSGRDGSINKPFISTTGWCVADGKYWEWNGEDGKVIKKVPNLNMNNYIKSINNFNQTSINEVTKSTGVLSETVLNQDNLPPIKFDITGILEESGEHTHNVSIINSNRENSTTIKVKTTDELSIPKFNKSSTDKQGNHSHSIDINSKVIGGNKSHTHGIDTIELDYLSVVTLFNIAETTTGMTLNDADALYVKKAGDVMSGALTVTNSLNLTYSSTGEFNYKNTSGEKIITIVDRNNSLNIIGYKTSQVFKVNRDGTLEVAILRSTSHRETLYKGRRILTSINGETTPNGISTISISTLPTGIPIPYPSLNIPSGWIKCSGQSIDKNRYPLLAKIYTNGYLPDLRGMFIRGWADDRKDLDVGRAILSKQEWMIKKHKHVSSYDSYLGYKENDPQFFGQTNEGGYAGIDRYMDYNNYLGQTTDGTDIGGVSNHGIIQHETRPTNVAFIYIIKGE